MTRHPKSVWTIAGLAALAVIGAAVFWLVLTRAASLRVAVAENDPDSARLIAALADDLKARGAKLRLVVRTVPDLVATSTELQAGRADLAVVRADVALPANGQSVAILKEFAVVVVTRQKSEIENAFDIAPRKLALLSFSTASVDLLNRLAQQEGEGPLQFERLENDVEAGAALARGRFDGVALTFPASDGQIAARLRVIAREAKGDLSVLGLPLSPARAARFPQLHEVEIRKGGLSGRLGLPAEDLKTSATSVRLMAGEAVDRGLVAQFTEALFQARARLAKSAPEAAFLKAVDVEAATASVLPIHPGAVDYFAREQKTFFERYGDWIYLAMFGGGGVASLLTWLRQRVVRQRREMVDDILDELMTLMQRARKAQTAADLDAVVDAADQLVVRSVAEARSQTFSTRTMGALMLAIDSLRAAIHEKRVMLAGEPSRGLPPGSARASLG